MERVHRVPGIVETSQAKQLYGGAVRVLLDGDAVEIEKRFGWHSAVDKTDAGDLQKVLRADSARAGVVISKVEKLDGAGLLRRAQEAEFRHQASGNGRCRD